MKNPMRNLFKLLLITCIFQAGSSTGQTPDHAQGLKEEFIEVNLSGKRMQAGVYSTKGAEPQPTILAVLLPGYPSVVRPVVNNGLMTSSRLTGNFLIRARRFLPDDAVASLIVDCESESGDYCSASYQASRQRQEDVDKLIDEVKKRSPSLTKVWLIGTSMGTISSSFMPTYNINGYSGAIHTAAITEPLVKGSYAELSNFDYRKSSIPQFFVHHRADPCTLTTYSGAQTVSKKYNIPLVSVQGGSDFRGPACAAFTEHGFRGKEKEVMIAIREIIKTGLVAQEEIR